MLNFHEIFGHDQIKDYFQKAIRANKVSHAYILDGEAGMGRKSLAHAFALSLLCEKGKNQPCMECHACKHVTDGKDEPFGSHIYRFDFEGALVVYRGVIFRIAELTE